MKKLFLAVAILGLVLGSCGGDSGGGSCAEIADDGMALVQKVIDGFDSMSLEDMTALGSEDPAFLSDMQSQFDDLDQRVSDAGCSDEELKQLFQERVGNLHAETELGQLMIDSFESQGLFD